MIRLHIGCGTQNKDGYINIDIRKKSKADIVCDITETFFPPDTIDLIEGYHVFEHLDRNKALSHWFKILKLGGKIIMELPNLERLVKKYGDGTLDWDSLMLIAYGNDNFETNRHVYGYSPESIKKLFESHGFKVLHIGTGTEVDRHDDAEAIRIEAIKPMDKIE